LFVALKLTAALKSNFFDRKKVRKKIGEANAKALARAGGRIRKSGQRNVRRRKKTSKPGQSPTGWLSLQGNNEYLRKILFALAPDGWGVVIGPVKFNSQQSPIATKLLEHGGTVVMPVLYIVQFDNGDVHHYRRFPHQFVGRSGVKIMPRQVGSQKGAQDRERMNYHKRPFMAPALKANLKHIPPLWRNSIRG
jgi:hypothetical protein